MTEYWNHVSTSFVPLDALAITGDIVDSFVEKYDNVQTTIDFEGARDDVFSDRILSDFSTSRLVHSAAEVLPVLSNWTEIDRLGTSWNWSHSQGLDILEAVWSINEMYWWDKKALAWNKRHLQWGLVWVCSSSRGAKDNRWCSTTVWVHPIRRFCPDSLTKARVELALMLSLWIFSQRAKNLPQTVA